MLGAVGLGAVGLGAVGLLLTLGCALAVSDNVLIFKVEEPPSRSISEPEQQAAEDPSDDRMNAADPQTPDDGLNAADPQTPDDGLNAADPQRSEAAAKYRLSYADYQVTWESFKSDHNKQYATKDEEKQRYSIFMDNVRFIESHNLKYHNGETTFYLGLNHLSDLTVDEYHKRMGLNRNLSRPSKFYCSDYTPPPALVSISRDWRKSGYVSPVKMQGECGSCYAFSAAGAIEGQWFKKTGKLISLSEQQIMDCSGDYNKGCDGGYLDSSFQYVNESGGLESEESYGYKEKVDTCAFDESKIVAKVSSCSLVAPGGSENALQMVVDKLGPVSASIDPSGEEFRFYKGGIYTNSDCDSSQAIHSILVVGYGFENLLNYWIVKNSWSTNWGEDGYIRMIKNRNNECGIANDVMFPNVG